MQLVGEVMGQVSDALHNSGVSGFDETNVKNDIGRIILEAAGSAAVAGVTGGNVGAATGSSVAGNVLSSATLNSVKQWADANSNGDPKLAMALTNAIENAIAAGGGAIAAGNNPNTLTDADIQQIQNAFSNSVNSTANLVEWGPLYAYAYLYNLIYGDTQSSGSASNEMTALPDANKGTTLTTPIVENNGTTVSTPIQAGDKKCLGFMLVKVA